MQVINTFVAFIMFAKLWSPYWPYAVKLMLREWWSLLDPKISCIELWVIDHCHGKIITFFHCLLCQCFSLALWKVLRWWPGSKALKRWQTFLTASQILTNDVKHIAERYFSVFLTQDYSISREIYELAGPPCTCSPDHKHKIIVTEAFEVRSKYGLRGSRGV